ncbi:alpha beta-hydrolase [Mycena amicta]|nr:alpha beta-hydrolase [Mycena amicta]
MRHSLLGLLSLSALSVANPVVKLPYGSFKGAFDGNLSAFLGVPFASPAVRFTLPGPPKPFAGVRDATEYGPACPQQALTPGPAAEGLPKTYNSTSEDCLTLSVFTPRTATAKSKLPVFVWIYGGGFEIGFQADQDVRPTVERSILKGEPVIVVTPNYRVTAFGFMGGKEVQKAGISNLGLRDQIFALEWVQKYISAFGGDPKRVTIGGISAGAISVGLLYLDNKRFQPANLFSGGVMLSGSPITTLTISEGQSDYDNLVTANNCTHAKDTLDCLRHVPLDAFSATVNQTPDILGYKSVNIVWRPWIDGDVIVQDPLVSVAEGKYAKLPFISGDADDEGTVFSFGNANITTNDEFLGYIHSNFRPKATASQIAKLGELYPQDPAQGAPFGTGDANQLTPEFKRLAAFQGDYIFVGARRHFLKYASATQNVWSYLSKRGKDTPFVGASHGSDASLWLPTVNTTDFVLSNALVNFINTLDPNHSAAHKSTQVSAIWPRWSNTAPLLFTLSDPDVVNITKEDFRLEPIKYLYNLLLDEAKAARE